MKEIKSTTAVFDLDVPYRLLETGGAGEKPLIVYLHGFNQNIAFFQKQVSGLLAVEAYHLFIQGPYPIYDRRRSKPVKDWGRAWYLYDGEQQQFTQSLQTASDFIEGVLEEVLNQISISRTAVLGYSMGGYLGGYLTLAKPQLVNELVVIGGRIKTESFDNTEESYNHLKVLTLHGSEDKRVQSEPQKRSSNQLSQWGAEVKFKEIKAGHTLDREYIGQVKQWLFSKRYKKAQG